ncbi:unnamed protein product [Absidia cylindrospora]
MNNPIPNEQNNRMSTTENPPSSSNDYAVQQQRITRTANAQLGQHFDRLANNIQGLSEGAQDVSNVVGNWDYVFGTMGLMNTDSGPGSRNPTIVNLPIVSNSKND